jgi:hypothetical protein
MSGNKKSLSELFLMQTAAVGRSKAAGIEYEQ